MHYRRYVSFALAALTSLSLGAPSQPDVARQAAQTSPALASQPPAPPVATAPATVCSAKGSGSISGTVRAPDGTPVRGVGAELYTSTGSRVSFDVTYSTGAYAFTGLPAGAYLIRFYMASMDEPYLAEWYDNQPDQASATPILLGDGQALAGVDATLALGAQITGRVVAAGGPLPGVSVSVYDSSETLLARARTDESGVYTTTPGLPTGSYKVLFSSPLGQPYLAEYYDDRPDLATASAVSVTAPNVRTGIDATLVRGAQIAGRVTAADTGLGIPNIGVTVYSDTAPGADTTYTGSGGYYTTTFGLAGGTHHLRFAPLFNDSDYLRIETIATVADHSLLGGVDVALELGGQIKGHVADSAGAPLQNIAVHVLNERADYSSHATTDAYGNYTAHAIRSDSYTVAFWPKMYQEEYYDDKPSRQLAERVLVAAPEVKTGIDAVLEKGGSMSGRVTAADTGAGLPSVYVEVASLSDGHSERALTDATGYYTFTSTLPGDAYRVRFTPYDRGAACAYIPEYYDDKRSPTGSDPVVIAAPNNTPNIDAVLDRGSSIAGRVRAADTGAGQNYVHVVVFDSSGETVAVGQTDASGAYATSPALPSGSYRIVFQPPAGSGYAASFYSRKPTFASADPIVVTAPSPRGGIDEALLRGIYLPEVRR
jgi:hypothetical protein